MKKYQVTIYILVALIGVLVGIYISKGEKIERVLYNTNKVDELMYLVHDNYVDSLSMEDIIEQTMPKILTELETLKLIVALVNIFKVSNKCVIFVENIAVANI